MIEQCSNIVDIEINNNSTLSSQKSSNNIYFILFIIFLVLFISFLIGSIYYWHKNNTKSVSKKFYDVIYSNTGTLITKFSPKDV